MLNKSVSIVLADGKTHNLRFDYNALCALEQQSGLAIGDLWTKLTGSIRLMDIRSIIWAGLIHEERSLTPEAVGEMIDFSKMAELAESVTKALDLAFKVEGQPKKEEEPKPTSSPSPGKSTSKKVSD
jgi:hypothetical protein